MSEKIKIRKEQAHYIPNDKLTKVYIGNHIVEAITIQNASNTIHNYKKISKDGCINQSTGEYITFSKNKDKKHSQNHFKNSVKVLRRIINLNFTGNNSEKFITLTYDREMTDYKKANKDFNKFWSLFKYRYPNCEYIRILEPQENGNWHLHILIKDTQTRNLYISQENIKSIWGKGGVWVENLPFADNFGAYFSVQFSTIKKDDETSKAFQKGSRIKFYPPNFKFYTCSKGIKKPEAIIMSHGDVKKIVHNHSPCYAYSNVITTNDDVTVNTITYEQYNLKRNSYINGKYNSYEKKG